MSGTKTGAVKAMSRIRDTYGETEDGKSIFHMTVGAKGGRASNTGGFKKGSQLARDAGRKGGTNSRRGKSKKRIEDMI